MNKAEEIDRILNNYPLTKHDYYNSRLICTCPKLCLLHAAEELIFDLGIDLEDIPFLNSYQDVLDFHNEVKENGIIIYNLSEKYRKEIQNV